MLKRLLNKLVPNKVLFRIHLWVKTTSSYTAIGTKGPLVTQVFQPVQKVLGWFTLDDIAHFHLVLKMQALNDVSGSMLEIGSYHGRSTAVMAMYLRDGEDIHVCDIFEADSEEADAYVNKPSPERLLSNIALLNPALDSDRIKIHQCLSNDLQLADELKFRFIHIDGGHSKEQVYFDLELATKHLLPKGIIVVDDYGHPHWGGIAEGTDKFLADNPNIVVLGDMNRHGALGRKLYLSHA